MQEREVLIEERRVRNSCMEEQGVDGREGGEVYRELA